VSEDKAIHLGHPSYVWGFGQERRLELVRRYIRLEGAAILDVGCGLGMYVRAFRRSSPLSFGIDVDAAKIVEAGREPIERDTLYHVIRVPQLTPA